LPPRDFDFRKRPIGNSGGFFCYAAILGQRSAASQYVWLATPIWPYTARDSPPK
jgi:hypothetical protein